MSDIDPLDAPRPPGGPQRTDAPAGSQTPGEAAPDPGPGTTRVTRPETSGTEGAREGERDGGPGGRVPDERDPDQSEASTDEHPLQLENAETSLDQPSQ